VEILIFTVAAAAAVAGGVGVIASAQPVRSALSLLMVLGSLAVLYLLLAAEFIAVLQVIVYAGAIVVLFLFVIMLLHARSGEGHQEKLPRQRSAGLILAAVFLGVLGYAMLTARGGALFGVSLLADVPSGFGSAQGVGRVLFSAYLLPFEVASVVLLVGIVAAVVLGRARPVG
jgi:NADH-quinone oxidoreductase subunit J